MNHGMKPGQAKKKKKKKKKLGVASPACLPMMVGRV
jgi:hypothetical protein